MRTPVVAGNWKMNGTRASIQELMDSIKAGTGAEGRARILVCVPFPYLQLVVGAATGTRIGVGAQNVCRFPGGAYTGEVAAEMLQDMGCCHVIVGHSERRALFSETDQQVAEKFMRARESGLIPILCVGETLEQREQGQTLAVVERQLMTVVAAAGVAAFADAVLAYEPVWAIGTGLTATPQQAQDVHVALRRRLAQEDQNIAEGLCILYGGSVKAASAQSLFECPDIDGGLIGGASLDADEFLAICRAAG